MNDILNILNLDFSQPIGSRIGFDGPERWTLKTPLDLSNDAIHKAFIKTTAVIDEGAKPIEIVWTFTKLVLLEMNEYIVRGFPEVYDLAVIERPTN